ncbi:hypothetical protein FOL47_002408 [Perkinsus chesapeaki]|uniref:DUF4470 domain-containing protein n=1 Tax=Perkinsus chesapeaki TaxID=330153 RepID=A0A7J6MDJ0_PERCH|nr:hypothetical protein FOL47_002408 [Perkinsus chesapeaki]
MTDSVRLSCSPVSSFVYRWTYLYPYTNTPPRDLAITCRGTAPKQPIRALLLGCSDLSSVAHTMYLNSISGTFDSDDWSTTPLQAVCCDFEPCIIARSLVYLQLIMKSDMSVSTIALAWEAVYCEIVSSETASLIRDVIGELCVMMGSDDSWADSLLAKCGVSVTGNKQKVIDVLEWWKDAFDNGDFSDEKVVQKILDARKCIPERLGRKGTQVDLLVASVVTKNKAYADAVDEFQKDGFVGVSNICSSGSTIAKISPIGSHKRSTLNPTFFADKCNLRKAVTTFNKKSTVEAISKLWRVHYGANPYCCIAPELADILATMAAPQTDFASSSACCKRGIALMSRLVDSLVRSEYLLFAKDDLFALLCEASLQKRMERNPMHPSVGCYEALRLSLSLHGVFPYEKVFMTSTPIYEVLLEMPCTWTEKAPYDTMSQKDIDRSADYRTVEVCFRHPAGIYISFPARMISDRQLVAVIPRIVYDSSLHGGTSALFKSVESICGLTEIPTKLIRVKEVPRRVLGDPRQQTSSLVECNTLKFTTREWLVDGCLRFVGKLVDNEKLKLLQQKKPISVRLCASDPAVVEVLTSGSCLASFSMVADVALNNVHLKVSRGEGVINITIPVTYGQRLTAKDTKNALPRAILATKQCAIACPTLSDQALSSISNAGGWVNVCLMGRQIPVSVRGNLESAMNCLRQTVGRIYATTLEDRERGQPWNGRAIATLECDDMTQALLLLSGEVRYDWNWGPTIRAGVCIFGDEVPKDLKSELRKVAAKYGIRELLCDKPSGELDYFVEGYVPAAVQLANISCGFNCDVNASSGESFWLPWLDWQGSPLSATALSHFKPIVIFPVYSPLGMDSDASSTESTKSPTDMLEEVQRKIFEDPALMKKMMSAAETGLGDADLTNLLRGAGITGESMKKKGKKTTASKKSSGSASSSSAVLPGALNGHPAAAASNDHQCEVLTHLCLGVLFSSGNVASYVLGYYVDMDNTYSPQQVQSRGAWIFAVQVFLMSVSVPIGSCMKPSIAIFTSGLLLAAAHAFSALVIALDYPFPYFLATYSMLGGIGIGLGYTAPMQVLFNTAPNAKRGLYAGITAASFGMGSFVFTQLQSRIVNPYAVDFSIQDPNYAVLIRVPLMLRVVGGVMLLLLATAAAVLPDEVATDNSDHVNSSTQTGLTWRRMLRTPHFWLLVIAFSANTQAITFIASTFKMMGTLLCGMNDLQLVKTWSLAAVVNAIGRVMTGALTTDPLFSLRAVSIGLAASLLFLSQTTTPASFLLGMCWNAFVLGGTFVVMPLATAALFGPTNFQKNYGLVFMGFGISALVAAWVTVPFLTSTLPPSLQLAVIAVAPTSTAGIAWLLSRLPSPLAKTDDWVHFYTETNRALVD